MKLSKKRGRRRGNGGLGPMGLRVGGEIVHAFVCGVNIGL